MFSHKSYHHRTVVFLSGQGDSGKFSLRGALDHLGNSHLMILTPGNSALKTHTLGKPREFASARRSLIRIHANTCGTSGMREQKTRHQW